MTEIFLDTANLDEIKEIKKWNVIKGITTNQKIFSKEKNVNFFEHVRDIVDIAGNVPISIEGPNYLRGLIEFADKLYESSIHGDIVVKVPMMGSGHGLQAIKPIQDVGYATNVTACMTLNQVFLAVLAGTDYVSLFYNRMIDCYADNFAAAEHDTKAKEYALNTVAYAQDICDEYGAQLIVGSIRSPIDVEDILTCEPDIITIPYKILKKMPYNSKTEDTLAEFEDAWKEFKKCEKNE